MATNEILQFASTNTGTNLLTQAEYAADAQRTTGNQPGIARSKLVNKSLRQVSLIAAGLAEFIADYQANNVTDSLTPQNIADYLLAAIQANIPAVPDASTTAKGKIEIATDAEVVALTSSLLAVTPASLKAFPSNGGGLGYMRLIGGLNLILSWQKVQVSPGAISDFSFPITFPNTCVAVLNSNSEIGSTTNPGQPAGCEALSTSTFRIKNSMNPNQTWSCNVIAIGY